MNTKASKPAHFLIVEDDDDHADLIELELRGNRVANTCDRVVDGAAALDYLHNRNPYANARRPDIILLDLKLPKVNGHEVLTGIKEDPTLRSIPVVVLTTSEAEIDKAKAYGSYVNSYLVKPVDFAQFHAMIKDLKFYWAAWNQVPTFG